MLSSASMLNCKLISKLAGLGAGKWKCTKILQMKTKMPMTIVYDPFEVIYPGGRPGIVGIAFNGKSLCRFSYIVMIMIMMMIKMMNDHDHDHDYL